MVNYNSDSYVMFLAPHSALSWPSWSSFVHPLVLLCFSFEAQICYLRYLNPSHIREFTVFEPGLTLFKFRTSFFVCYTITTTQHCLIYPKLECAKTSKYIFVYLCPSNRVQTCIGILSFPMKASLQKIYTSKVPEDWLNCIWQRMLLFICKSWMALFLNLHQLPLPPGHRQSWGFSSIDSLK